MIKIENCEIVGMEEAIRGMRNPMNSWEQSDSYWNFEDYDISYIVGSNDAALMHKLALAGSDHAKYRRMITVYMDITAPLYWWKEFDTYKVGTVANSCSTMHKIAAKEFTLDDFSHDHLLSEDCYLYTRTSADGMFTTDVQPIDFMEDIIRVLNICRTRYLENPIKKYWWQMIQLLPSSYNQKRTVMLNFEVLSNMYRGRRHHKLDEWQKFCDYIESIDDMDLICTRNTEVAK